MKKKFGFFSKKQKKEEPIAAQTAQAVTRGELTCDYVLLLPGNPSSALQSTNVNLLFANLLQMGKRVIPISARSCNIYVVRNGCLANSMSRHRRDQKPWEGLIADYDRMIWIDSDNIVTTEDVLKLLAHDVDIVAGWYRQYAGGDLNDDNLAACGYWDRRKGYNKVNPLKVGEIASQQVNDKGLIEVDYAGMGCMIIKKGIFEKMEYPWFRPDIIEWEENGVKCADVDTDDAGWCHRVKQLGFKIHVDPKVRILHEKLLGC